MIADAILDRVMQKNHRFNLTGESLRGNRKSVVLTGANANTNTNANASASASASASETFPAETHAQKAA